jgi:hypothetical protein
MLDIINPVVPLTLEKQWRCYFKQAGLRSWASTSFTRSSKAPCNQLFTDTTHTHTHTHIYIYATRKPWDKIISRLFSWIISSWSVVHNLCIYRELFLIHVRPMETGSCLWRSKEKQEKTKYVGKVKDLRDSSIN